MNIILKRHIFLLLLILCSSFFLIISVETYEKQFNGKTSFDVSVVQASNKKFGEFILEGDKADSKYILSAYSDQLREKRIQLGQSFKGKIKIYLYLRYYQNIYMEVECANNNDCSGKVIYSFIDKIDLEKGEPISYYVNGENEEIEFNLNVDAEKSNIWARGQYPIETQLEGKEKKTIENRGDFYIIDGKLTGTFIVKPTKGDYINVGYIGYKHGDHNYDSNQDIEIDGPSLTGYLKKGKLDEICYTINEADISDDELVLGNGIIFTKIGYSYISYKSGTEYPNGSLYTSGFIKNGLFFPKDNQDQFKICITFPKSDEFHQFSEVNEIIFVYQLEKATVRDFTLYEPQLNGVLYPRTIQKGSKTAFISQKDSSFNKMSLNLMSLTGFPKMYVIECENYPICDYDNKTLYNNKTIRPRNINRLSSLYVNKKEGFDDSPISKRQTVFVVECMQSQNRTDTDILPEYMDFICEYNTLIYRDKDYIELIEENYFNQFTLLDQVHNYKIKIGKESGIKKIFIDIMIYVGDVDIDFSDFAKKGVKADLYHQINKIFISAKINGNSENVDDLIFSVKGLNNTFYTTLITFANKDNDADSFITNKLQTGMSYLVTIDTSQYDDAQYANKIIKFKNERAYDFIPFMVNLYSLNCEIEGVGLYDKKIYNMENFEQILQDVVDTEEDRYLSSEYEYRINVKVSDSSQYDGNLCKLYASAIELRDSHEIYSRDILVPDNTPQQIRFGNDVKHVSFGYIHVDFQCDLLIKFNLKHVAEYTVTLYYENHIREKQEKIVANNMLLLESDEWSTTACRDKSRVCYITLDITLEKKKEDKDKPVLEFSIKSMDSYSVDYIPKEKLKIDYVKNNQPQYYYTEVGANERGFIMANFERGSGQIFARIVKSKIDNPEDPKEWRGQYRIPHENDQKIEPFTKGLTYFTLDDCEKGCYLLLSVFSDVKGYDLSFDRYYAYSLIVHSSPNNRNYNDVPIIKIPVDEYIIGAVEPSSQHNRMFNFYSVWLNYDADQVIIDFQSDAAGIFINVGEGRPTTESAHFPFWPAGHDTIHIITKEQILVKAKPSQKEKGLKDIILTIGIWANMTDSIFTTPFSFAVRLEDDKENEIYRVNSDQKVLCNPKKNGENNYRCVYVIDYNFVHKFAGFFIYANVQDKSALFNIYARTMNANEYEMSPKSELNKLIPNKDNNIYSTASEQTDYLYIIQGTKREEYLLVSVEADKETVIEFMSTILIYQEEITPNPSSPQLYSALPGHKFYLNFPNEYMEMVNIVCLGGEGKLYWSFDESNVYTLKGRDDRLSITSNQSSESHKLHIEGIGDENPSNAFVFIVEYNIRLDHVNFDLLNLEKSINYIYANSDFPITYYTPLTKFNEISKDNNDFYDIFFTFDKLESIVEKNLTYYENQPFIIHGFIVKESLVYEAKLIPEITPTEDNNTIIGFYDQALRTGLIRITQENIKQSKILDYDRPYLYLELDKSDTFKNIRRYKRVSLETSVSYTNSKNIISEVSNQFGYLSSNQNEANYVLRNHNKYKYMYIEFSCMDDNLSIKINKGNLEKISSYGKTIYYTETKNLDDTIILSVNRAQNNNKNEEYFLFRYYFEDNIVQNKYSIKDPKPKVIEEKYDTYSNFKVEVNPLTITDSNSNDYNITYIVRLVAEEKLKPKRANLALKPVKQSIKEFYNPKNTSFEIQVDKVKSIKYIEVILQIKYKEILEYLSYELADKFQVVKKSNTTIIDNNDRSKVALIACITIGAILFIIVVVLIIVIIIFNNKNKDLLEKVNKVSFADNDQRGDDDLLLSKD